MLVAMALAAVGCVVIGVAPGLLYHCLPYPVEYHPYTLQHMFGTLGMLGFTALGFFLLLKHLDPEPKISLDTDWFYRRGAAPFMSMVVAPLARFESGFVGEIYQLVMRRIVAGGASLLRQIDARIVDAAAVSVGRITRSFSQVLASMVSGNAQHYGLIMAAGVLALLALAVLLQ